MKAASALPLEQHNIEIQRNQLAGQRKPVLCFTPGGFSGPQLGGRFRHGLLRGPDIPTAPLPRACAARRLVVLEKENA